jgi:hypothetical protein
MRGGTEDTETDEEVLAGSTTHHPRAQSHLTRTLDVALLPPTTLMFFRFSAFKQILTLDPADLETTLAAALTV